jgi:hypothetical protein
MVSDSDLSLGQTRYKKIPRKNLKREKNLDLKFVI